MDQATFERFGAFVAEFAEAFHDSRAYRVIGEERFYELRLELDELRRATETALANERGRERVLTPLNARLLHECLNVAHVCMNTDAKVRELMPDCFRDATRDSCYVMQQVDTYLMNKRIDALDFEIPEHQMHNFMEPWINYDAALKVTYVHFFGKLIDGEEEDADDTIHGPDWS